MYTLEQFKKDVIQWSTDRLIIQNGTVEGQLNKLDEELRETMHAIINLDDKEQKDGIGDCAVVLINLDALQNAKTSFILAEYDARSVTAGNLIDRLYAIKRGAEFLTEDYQECWLVLQGIAADLNFNFLECCELAWNEIKDRKGYFCDKTKTFIKDIEGEVVSGTVLIEAKAVTE